MGVKMVKIATSARLARDAPDGPVNGHDELGGQARLEVEAVDVLRVEAREFPRPGVQQLDEAVGERRSPALFLGPQDEGPAHLLSTGGVLFVTVWGGNTPRCRG